MDQRLSEQDGRTALRNHALDRGLLAASRFPTFDSSAQIEALLQDRDIVRYPVELVFDDARLQSLEAAFLEMCGQRPSDGFRIYCREVLRHFPKRLAACVLYQVVRVNYGDIATSEDAEAFGATALGDDVETYYQRLCETADSFR